MRAMFCPDNSKGFLISTNIFKIILSQTIKWLNLRRYILLYIMRKSVLTVLALCIMLAMTGCDFMRKLAGRPTSEDIERARIEMLQAQELALQQKLDSLKQEKQAVQDSIDALELFVQQGGTVLNPSRLGGLYTTKLQYRYYVIIGAFRTRSNAEALLTKAESAGYKPVLISFRNGLLAVGLCPVDERSGAVEMVSRIKNEPFCPSDVWILVNE